MSASVPLLINADRPLKGPHVPLVRRYGHVIVSGLRKGNKVLLIGCSKDGRTELILIEIESDGDHPIVIPKAAYVRVAYIGLPNPELAVYLQ